jgi:hypothetical protein
MNTYYSGRFSRPAGLFSFDLLDGSQVRCVALTCEKPTGKGASWRAWGRAGEIEDFGLSRFATAFMNNPG